VLKAVQCRLCASFAAVLALPEQPVRMVVDMPIGLQEGAEPGGRSCDRAARRRLGRRRSSVFAPPTRAALPAGDYRDALARSRASSGAGLGLSRQACNLLPKLRELDGYMTARLQDRVLEGHPELAFAALTGEPMAHSKRRAEGRRERSALLARQYGDCLPDVEALLDRYGRGSLAADDILDACVLALTAWRIQLGQGRRLPEGEPPLDARGLRMEIWY
jgi:predicted RNase H-like nuclease